MSVQQEEKMQPTIASAAQGHVHTKMHLHSFSENLKHLIISTVSVFKNTDLTMHFLERHNPMETLQHACIMQFYEWFSEVGGSYRPSISPQAPKLSRIAASLGRFSFH
jgi:hypothetical protein